jgi:hypothetical protein
MGAAVTSWSGAGYEGDPIDPNPTSPAPPPGYYGTASPAFGYPPSGYPAPPYPWAGYGAPVGPARPTTVTAVSVLAFVLAALILLDGFLLLVGASVVESIEHSLNQSSGLPPSLVANGLLNLVVGASLITGGVLFSGSRPAGRWVLAIANVVAVGQSIYWTVVSDVGALAITVLHAGLAVGGLALAFTAGVAAWLRAGPPDR